MSRIRKRRDLPATIKPVVTDIDDTEGKSFLDTHYAEKNGRVEVLGSGRRGRKRTLRSEASELWTIQATFAKHLRRGNSKGEAIILAADELSVNVARARKLINGTPLGDWPAILLGGAPVKGSPAAALALLEDYIARHARLPRFTPTGQILVKN